MSFAQQVKQELLSARKTNRPPDALAYGLLAFARALSPDEVALHTESADIAALYRRCLARLCPKDAQIGEEPIAVRGRGKALWRVWLPAGPDRRALLARLARAGEGGASLAERFARPEQRAACLAGAFLVCGNVTDPEKSYHLEWAVREQPLADELAELVALPEWTGRIGRTRRRGAWVVYLKEKSLIEDLLTLMGASKASLAVVDVEITKEVRNRAMRQTNCETANIDKTVRAASSQIEDIELVLERRGLDSLPPVLRQAALTRIENPELSLRELAAYFDPPMSRSGVHHRLAALSALAQELRTERTKLC